MKKINLMMKMILISSVASSSLLATEVTDSLGVNLGIVATKNSDSIELKSPTLGLSYQNRSYVLMPRVDLEYVQVKDDQADTLIKGSVNGVYEFFEKSTISPYILAGMGYESVKGGTVDVFESHPFAQAAGGVNYSFDNDMKLNAELKVLQIMGGEDESNEVIVTAGLSFPIGYSKVKPKPVVAKPTPIIIQAPAPQYIPEPAPVKYIDENECSIKIDLPDLDRDGIEDELDQCPATPCNFTVDSYGCPIKATLKINFATGSAVIETNSQYKIDKFAQFLLKNKGSLVKIVGHTDNVGTQADNLSLSKRRANAVMQAIISRGVSPSRLTSNGQGENMPVATNDTVEGRAMNRRIEAELSYPRGIR